MTTATTRRTSPKLAVAHHPIYVDYTHTSLTDHIINGSATIVALFRDVSALVPHAGPLYQVLGVTKELLSIVNEMKENREGCEHLIERILLFLKNLIEECSQLNIPIQHGSPTAARLYALTLNIGAIKGDAERWRDLRFWDRILHRSVVKTALSRHGQNLSDCFQMFAGRTLLQLSTIADATANAPPINSEEYALHQNAAHSSATLSGGSHQSSAREDSTDIQHILRHSAGQTMFGQINQAVRSNVEDITHNVSSGVPRVVAFALDNRTMRPGIVHIGNGPPDLSAWGSKVSMSDPGLDIQAVQPTCQDVIKDPSSDSAGGPSVVMPGSAFEGPAVQLQADDSSESSRGSNVGVFQLAFDSQAPTPRHPSPIDDHLDYIADRVENVTLKVIEHFPSVTNHLGHTGEQDNIAYTPSIRQVGRPSRQLDQTIADTFELLDQLQDVGTQSPEEVLAEKMSNLSLNLHDLGLEEEALGVQTFCVVLYRGLVEKHDLQPPYTQSLAISLDHLSNYLSGLGYREQALTSAKEAVELCRHLTAQDLLGCRSDLSRSLHNLSLRLSDIGHRQEALSTIQEAVLLCRQLAKDYPDMPSPALASSLDNLSYCLSNLGFHNHALDAAQDAVDLQLQLAEDPLAMPNPDLAISLCNLSKCFSELEHHQQALYVIQESVELHRQLAVEHPAAFNIHHAMALDHLSICLSHLNHWDRALVASQEGVRLHRKHSGSQPAAFNSHLARSLGILSSHFSHLGIHGKALDTIEEAVKLHRNLAVQWPDMFNPDLAVSLDKLSHRLSSLGKHRQALEAIQASIQLHQGLAADHPAAFDVQLATSLLNLSNCHSCLGDQKNALTAIQEATDLYRKLAEECPTSSFKLHLATSLSALSNHLSVLGSQEKSVDIIQEAVGLYRQLAADEPTIYSPNLSGLLMRLSKGLSHLGRLGKALDAIKESVHLYRQLAAQQPALFNAELAMSLNRLGVCLVDLNHQQQALDAVQESVDLYRQLATVDPTSFTQGLAKSLGSLSICLSHFGHWNTALVTIQEVVSLYQQLAVDNPAQYKSRLAASLKARSRCFYMLGCGDEAQTLTQEEIHVEGEKISA